MHAANFAALGMEAEYTAHDIATEGDVAPFLRKLCAEGCAGANVTVPYKHAAYDAMDVLAPSAQKLGVVNTVVFENGTMTGHNTDGIGFLRDKMWDAECGGFYWEIADNGTPPTSNSEMKHAYGISFGIYAAATVYELTKDEADLKLAKDAFHWLDRFGHDAQFGGYYEAFYRDGRPMLAPPQDRPNIKTGKVSEQLGGKSMNTHIHLLEAFTVLYKVYPDPTLRSRLEELLLIIRDRITTHPAALRQFFDADWTPAATLVSFGHDVETAFLMEEAIDVLGRPNDEKTLSVCKALVDHSLQFGWDEKYGGFYNEGATYAHPVDIRKVWWVQAEGLNTLHGMYRHYGESDSKYGEKFIAQWNFIKRSMIDAEHGGWFNTVSESGVHPPGEHSKANLWKTAYHETRALLNIAEGLKASRKR
jgi:mannobiose 2-epimerase